MLPWLTESSADRLIDVRDTSLSKLVRDDMLALILKGDLVPGQRINEPDVASRLRCRACRCARPCASWRVRAWSCRASIRAFLCASCRRRKFATCTRCAACSTALPGASAAGLPDAQRETLLALLGDSVDAMLQAASQHDVQRYYGENLRFHWAIVESAGNGQLTDTYRGIVQKLHLSRLKNLSQDIGMQASIAEHLEIVAGHCRFRCAALRSLDGAPRQRRLRAPARRVGSRRRPAPRKHRQRRYEPLKKARRLAPASGGTLSIPSTLSINFWRQP